MSTTNHRQLLTLTLGDEPEAWRAAGFDVAGDRLRLGYTTICLSGGGTPFEGWAIDGVEDAIDGLPAGAVEVVDDGAPHPNGISRIDHVVIRTGDVDRTISAFVDAGFEVRGGRSTSSYGAPMRQTFFWAGDVIVELVGPDDGEPTTDEPTTVFGLALVADDLDRTASHLGALLGTPKGAVQAGRRIAGLRGKDVGIALPLAVMSPHVGAGGAQATDG